MNAADREFLGCAIRLAMNGRGAVEPNPMVGCVIVKDGRVIGEGFHVKFGGPHAEPNALAACRESPRGATAYVTLEPCCHTHKKTPPCVPQLIAAGVRRVIAGSIDPNPDVSGKGLSQLREAGIEAIDAADPRCLQLLAPFVARTVHRRPYATLKWAQTADGKVAGPGGRPIPISNAASQRLVHRLRSRCDAILVGIGTVQKDNPRLTVRGTPMLRPLTRIVLDSDLRLSIDSHLAQSARESRVIVFCSKDAAHYSGTRTPLAALGIEIHPVSSPRPGALSLPDVLENLGTLGITHLLVEPGPTLAASFFEEGLADRVWVFRSALRVDDSTAPAAARVTYPQSAQEKLDDDTLTEYLNPNGKTFAALEPSPDFVIERPA